MVGLINFGAGLSAMGQSLADSSLLAEKNALDNQKLELASQLTEGRESRLQAQQQTFQAGQSVAQRQFEAGQQTERLGAEKELETGRESSAQKIASGEQATQLKVAAIQAGISSKEVSMDANTGNAILVDKRTGKVTPVVGDDGKPIQLPNPAQAQMAMSAINQANEELRNLNVLRSQDLTAARSAYSNALMMSGGNPQDDKVISAKKDLEAVDEKYKPSIDAIHSRIDMATAAMFNKSGVNKGAPGGPAKPPMPAPPKGFTVLGQQ